MPHQRQAVFEQQFADRRLAADPAEQIGLPSLDQRRVEERLRIDFVAGLRARQQFGDDRISLGEGQQYRMPHHGLAAADKLRDTARSEEHTSELQSLMRISYAVFCLKKKTQNQ